MKKLDDHFCPDCPVGSDIMSENPVLSELASRWQFDGDEYQIRFDLLAKYLVENGDSFDAYFKTQATSCAMCSIDFQYIIKLETLHEGKRERESTQNRSLTHFLVNILPLHD